MCIAIYAPADKPKIPKERLSVCNENNPHGAGLAYVNKGELYIQKGFFDFEEFWAAYQAIPENSPTLLHFRIATSGEKDETNCHPWRVNDDVCLIHNGVLSDFAEKECKISDTGNFAEHWMKPIMAMAGNEAYNIPCIKYAIYKIAGNDKIVFLNKNGNVFIFNDDLGTTEDGIWYSNTSFRPKHVKNSESKDTTSPIYVNTVKRDKYVYIKVGEPDFRPLTSHEVSEIIKHHHLKLKKLVKSNVLRRVQLNASGRPIGSEGFGEGQEGLDNWLKKHSN